MQRLSDITEKALGTAEAGVNEQLRWAFEIAMACSWHSKRTIADFGKQLRAAIRHQHIRFFFNSRDEAVGYVIWAHVDEATELRALQQGRWDLHISEWTGGAHMWILDLAAPYGHGTKIFRRLLRDPRTYARTVRYASMNRGKYKVRELTVENRPLGEFEAMVPI